MLDIAKLRARIDSEFDGECHLTSVEARLLFDVYEASEKWRHAPCSNLAFCDRGDHEHDCTVMQHERNLCTAIDAARGQASPT